MGTRIDFKVTTKANHVVAAAMPLQDHLLPLSNLDFLLPPLDVNVFFCYKNDTCVDEEVGQQHDNDNKTTMFKHKVSVLKKALAQALAYFYPFAGEVVENSAGEPEILCNNRGVVFVEAFADVELCELDLYNPDESVEGKLVPKKKDAVFSVQVTELKCGGIVVACAFNHQVADAYSANMFWATWAEMATSKPISTTPCFRRSLLSPNKPLNNNNNSNNNGSYFDEMYLPISALPKPNSNQPSQEVDPLITRVYLVSKDQLNKLQSLCCEDLEDGSSCKRKSSSKLQCFSAFLWQIIASHACQLDVENWSKLCKMGIVVDGRSRLSNGASKEEAQSFASYFGNVLTIPFGEQKCGDLKEMPITNMVELVHKFLQHGVTKDHFLGLIDWVEAQRPNPAAVTKIYCTQEGDGPAFVVSSGLRFPVSKMDFGWGKPTFGSYHFPWGGICGYVMPMPTPSENGDWIVYMHLNKKQLDFIEAQASDVFKPFSLDLINSN